MKENKLLYGFAVWLGVFFVFTVLVCCVDVAPIGPNGTSVGFAMINGVFHQWTGVSKGWKLVSKAGIGFLMLFSCGYGVLALKQFFATPRKIDRRLVYLFCFFVLVVVLDKVFSVIPINMRPVFESDGTLEPSYPSSHTLIGMSCLGASWIFVRSCLADIVSTKFQRLLVTLHGLAILLTVGGRALCGVHWLTDIAGGILLSTALLFLFKWCIGCTKE